MFDLGRRGLPKTDPTLLRLRLIGSMEARTMMGESVLPIGGKTKGLLAILALADRKPVNRSRLSELLWSRRPDDLARASLRQEIHRLLDALSPLGVDVIDVQRHALSLKPVLTSVDAERILTAGLSAFEELGAPSDLLLSELNGIDPAFDIWLDEQRTRISRHIQMLLENVLRDQNDPEILLDAADRLLNMDELNEAAWRARMQAAAYKGEHAQAALYAEQAIRTFESRLGQSPGTATMALIANLRRMPAPASAASANGASPVPLTPAPASHGGDMLLHDSAMPDHLHMSNPEVSRRIATLTILPIEAAGNDRQYADDMLDALSVALVNLNVFNVVTPPDPSARHDMHTARRSGVDFAVTGIIRHAAGEDGTVRRKLLVRLLDLRPNGSIIWASRIELPQGDEADFTGIRHRFGTVCSSIQWAVFLFEARRMAHRPAEDLSAIGLSVRALMLLLRGDRQLLPEIVALVDKARRVDPEQPLVALARALALHTQYAENLGQSSGGDGEQAIIEAQSCYAQWPENPTGCFLVAFLSCRFAHQISRAEAMLAAMEEMLTPEALETFGICIMLQAFVAMIQGDRQRAVERVEKYSGMRTEHPVGVLLDPLMVQVLFFCGKEKAAIQMGSMITGLYPRRASVLVYYLAALGFSGMAVETTMAREQLLSLIPGLTVEQVMGAHQYLPAMARDRLAAGLRQAGLNAD